jgi:preprotein translocase SecE subunit
MAQDKKKKVEKKKVKKEPFLKSVKNEMKLVKWPTWKEVLKNTIATLVLVVVVVLFFLLLNFILSYVKGVFA